VPRTYEEKGPDKLQKAHPRLPTVHEEEENSLILEEQITSFGNAMAGNSSAPRNAHGKARAFFSTLTDSDDDIHPSSEDFEESGSSEGFDDKVQEELPTKSSFAVHEITNTAAAPVRKQVGRPQSMSRQRSTSRQRVVKDSGSCVCDY
jgi:hypothetical protein